jgi:hypothetical protein
MARDHVVKEGECMASIAAANGFRLETLWDHPDNAELKARRRDPYVLAPGDVVRVPELRAGEAMCSTGKLHRFRRRGVPEKLTMHFLEDGKPRAGITYTLEVGAERRKGTTDADGWVRQWIAPGQQQATLTLEPPGRDGEEPLPEVYDLALGGLDPADTERGARARLRGLGYLDYDDDDPDVYQLALYTFQIDQDLNPSGKLDAPTSKRLSAIHGA